MKNCGMIVIASALLMLIQATGRTSTTPTASTDQRGKSNSRLTPGKGGYGPVVKEQLRGEYTCWATGSKRAQFQLTFTEEHFEMKGDKGPIPREVLDAVLGIGKKAEKIGGRWELAAGKLALTEIQADGKAGFKDVALRPFRTGPNIVRFMVGETQYILIPKPKSDAPSGHE